MGRNHEAVLDPPAELAPQLVDEINAILSAELEAPGEQTVVEPPVQHTSNHESSRPLSETDKTLWSFDALRAHRRPDGTYSQSVLDDNLQDHTTRLEEQAMAYVISKTEHEAVYYNQDLTGERKRTFMHLGKMALSMTIDGVQAYQYPFARRRGHVEVEEALHAPDNMRPGVAQAFISPRATKEDATAEEAEAEFLADCDAVRITFPVVNAEGEIIGRKIQSLLVKDIPLSAWVAMLADPGNIFGKAISVEDNGSALPVMEAFKELELPVEKCANGPVALLEAVLPYITDPEARKKVAHHIRKFHEVNQAELRTYARNLAIRQQYFDRQLVNDDAAGYASKPTIDFIMSYYDCDLWGDGDLELIRSLRQPDGRLKMSRDLVECLEIASQNEKFVRAGVVSNNRSVIVQLAPTEVNDIKKEEQARLARPDTTAVHVGNMGVAQVAAVVQADIQRSRQNNVRIANRNVQGGGGCPGASNGRFKRDGNGGNSGNRRRKKNNEFEDDLDDESLTDLYDSAEDVADEDDGIPSMIRCIECRRYSSKNLVVQKDSWRCPCCKYEIDICTGKVLHESVQIVNQRIGRIFGAVSISGKLALKKQTQGVAVASPAQPAEKQLITA